MFNIYYVHAYQALVPFCAWIDFNKGCWHTAFGVMAQKTNSYVIQNFAPKKCVNWRHWIHWVWSKALKLIRSFWSEAIWVRRGFMCVNDWPIGPVIEDMLCRLNRCVNTIILMQRFNIQNQQYRFWCKFNSQFRQIHSFNSLQMLEISFKLLEWKINTGIAIGRCDTLFLASWERGPIPEKARLFQRDIKLYS